MHDMSYDLAVWEGPPPSGEEAGKEFRRLYEHYVEADSQEPPTPRITVYVQALLARYPDIDSPAGDDSPWSTAPLMDEAVGPIIYFPMGYGVSEEVSAWAAQLAQEHGLVCYDPQMDSLRP